VAVRKRVIEIIIERCDNRRYAGRMLARVVRLVPLPQLEIIREDFQLQRRETKEDNGKDSQNKHTDLRPRAMFTNL